MDKPNEPELICIESDDDEAPPPASVPSGNRQSVSVLVTGGQAIDLAKLRSSHLDEIVRPIQLPAFTYVSRPATSNRLPAISQSTRPRSRPIVNQSADRTKHHGLVNQILETAPLEQAKRVIAQVLVANENLPTANNLRLAQTSPPNEALTPPIAFNFRSEARTCVDHQRRYEVTDARAEDYTFDAVYTSFRANTRSTGPTCLVFRFKCTFGNCHRIIRGDVNFMFHLWAHVATSTEKVDLYTPKGMNAGRKKPAESRSTSHLPGVEYACRCPECLVVFHTPVLMQIHYTKVHSLLKQAISKYTCLICEKDFQQCNKVSLREHLEQHNPNDAPYQCRICNFRSTIRSNVIQHYIEKHRDTGNLMCPFCLWVSNTAPAHRSANTWNIKTPLVYNQQFVKHMLDHATKKRIGCNNCATAIVAEYGGDSQGRDLSIGAHRTVHNFDTGKHDYVRISTKSKRLQAKTEMQIKSYNCIECAKQISSIVRQNEQCQECFKKSFWKRAYDRCGVKPGPSGSKYECECGLVTTIVEKIMYHYNDTRHNFKLVTDNSKTEEPCAKKARTEEDDVEPLHVLVKDLEEAKIFAEYHETPPLEELSQTAQQSNYSRLVAEEDDLMKKANKYHEDEKEAALIYNIASMNRFLSLPYLKAPEMPPMSSFVTNVRATTIAPAPRVRPRRGRGNASEEGKKRDHHHAQSVSIMKPMQQKKNDSITNIHDLDDDDDDDDEKPAPKRTRSHARMERLSDEMSLKDLRDLKSNDFEAVTEDSLDRESSETRTDPDVNGMFNEEPKELTPDAEMADQVDFMEEGELFIDEDALLALEEDDGTDGQVDAATEAALLNSNPSSVEILTD